MGQTIIFLLTFTCFAAADVPSPDERRLIVETHAKIREIVNPSASDMKLMKYSEELEQQAEKSLSECIVDEYSVTAYSNNTTQNLRIFFDEKPTYVDMVTVSSIEAQNYDYDANTCADECTEYKRIVWADSTRVGCAMHKCGYSDPERSKPIYSVICQYDPIERIEKRRPYIKGPSCGMCPPGYECLQNQCAEIVAAL
uniref:SCP domain-containing protein n=1 Tax=Mesocestoides corti TaxID=53468 RepID=A0A5K3F838_MESCO